jgi:hypothetical protein
MQLGPEGYIHESVRFAADYDRHGRRCFHALCLHSDEVGEGNGANYCHQHVDADPGLSRTSALGPQPTGRSRTALVSRSVR